MVDKSTMSDTICEKLKEDPVNGINNYKKNMNDYFDESSQQDEKLTLEDLAPDGGWGWMAALGLVIAFITTFAAGMTFTIIFGEFYESTGQAGSVMTLLNAVFMISFSVSGAMTNALLQKFSLRVVGVGSALFFAIPNILSAWVTHVYQLAIIFFIQGIGLGLMNTICNANLNAFFVKKRAKVMSAAQAIIGLGAIIYPIIVEKMMAAYGWRATAALMGAISLNSIVGMMMMHPVEWHLRDSAEVLMERRMLRAKKIELDELPLNSKKTLLISASKRRSTIHVIHDLTELNRWNSFGSLKNHLPKHDSMEIQFKQKEFIATDADDVRPRSGSMRTPLTNSLSILPASLSIGNIADAVVNAQQRKDIIITTNHKESKEPESSELIEKRRIRVIRSKSLTNKKQDLTLLETLEHLFEFSLLKDRSFMIMSIGISLVLVSDYTFISLLPLAMLHAGYTNSETALTITVSATAELASRVLYLIFTLFINVRSKVIFFFAMIIMGLAKFVFFSFGTSLTGILVSTVIIGVVRSFILVPQPLVIVENYPVEKYAVCYGIFSLVNGIALVIMGPLVGVIKDVTNSFDVGQLVLIAINCAFIVPWAIEFIVEYRKVKNVKNIKNDAS